MLPVTSGQLRPLKAPEMGLVPTSPVMMEAGTSVMPDLESRANPAAEPRSTGAGPWARPWLAVWASHRVERMTDFFRMFFTLTPKGLGKSGSRLGLGAEIVGHAEAVGSAQFAKRQVGVIQHELV